MRWSDICDTNRRKSARAESNAYAACPDRSIGFELVMTFVFSTMQLKIPSKYWQLFRNRTPISGSNNMVKAMRQVALSELKDDLSKYLHMAEKEEIVITKHGKPAGVLVGFASEDDWFDYKLEHDPRFLQRIAQARRSLRSGSAVKLEDLDP
jgi:prevent-host-death family protein